MATEQSLADIDPAVAGAAVEKWLKDPDAWGHPFDHARASGPAIELRKVMLAVLAPAWKSLPVTSDPAEMGRLWPWLMQMLETGHAPARTLREIAEHEDNPAWRVPALKDDRVVVRRIRPLCMMLNRLGTIRTVASHPGSSGWPIGASRSPYVVFLGTARAAEALNQAVTLAHGDGRLMLAWWVTGNFAAHHGWQWKLAINDKRVVEGGAWGWVTIRRVRHDLEKMPEIVRQAFGLDERIEPWVETARPPRPWWRFW